MEYVHSGSIFFADCWKGYIDVTALGFLYFTVGNSKKIVNPVTGVHRQRIENLWCIV
jgi:hypothetical protein